MLDPLQEHEIIKLYVKGLVSGNITADDGDSFGLRKRPVNRTRYCREEQDRRREREAT